LNPVVEVGLIAQRELRRNFRSAKGVVMAVLTLLGGLGITLIRLKAEQMNAGKFSTEDIQQLQEALLARQYGDEMGHYLAAVPPMLLGMLVITVWLAPFLIAVLGFDAIAGEMQHRTVRYFTMRSRRASYFIGKTLGLFLVVSIITFCLHALVWILAVTRGGVSSSVGFGWGIHLWLVTLPINAAWCGYATFIGSQFRSPILSLLVTFASFFVMWVLGLIGMVAETVKWIGYVYPNTFEDWMLSPHADRVSEGAAICVGMCVLMASIGAVLFTRKDV
jgi:ABC-type transport system involved in multi-copper enzyme maturation permease subunit